MRYHLESTLPIHAFQPLGGRHSLFKQGMTLEGGGGGGIVSAITDPISSALGTDGGGGGILGALADVDKAVGDTVPGGWGTIAAVAVPYLAPELIALQAGTAAVPLTAGQAAAVAAGTSAATGAIRGDDLEDILKNAALAGGTSYGLNTLFGDAGYIPDEGSPYIDGTPPPSYRPNYVPDEGSPYIDGTPPPNYSPPPSYTPDEASPYIDGTPPADVIPPDLSVFNPYIDSPDGLTQLGYSPDQLAAITSSVPPALSPEEKFELMMRNAQEAPMSSNFSPAVDANSNFIVDRSQPIPNPEMLEKGYLDRMAELPGAAYDMAKSYVVNNPYTSAALGLGALSLANRGQEPQPSGSPVAADSRYTGGYGSSGGVASPYLLRNRVTASNVYDYENPFDRYATVNRRYAKGGEVKHFALGGISNAITRFTQPIEKAIVQPVGQALPFLKDVAPYAGILAAPFITSPAMAVGVGALSSGFGRPGTGFDMKRALMGGIAAYGASTVGAGLEAAGTEPTKPLVDTLAESYAVPGTEVPVSTAAPKGFFRDTDAMQRGVGNLLSSDSDAATKAFSTKAGTFKSGIPLVMGTSGMMAIDEANKMREEAERSAGPAKQEQADMLARIAKGRKRAEDAVRANPYMYAMGGSVDDELGGDYSAMGMDQGNMQKGLFGIGYAEGGNVSKKSTRLEDNLPELNDNFRETNFEGRSEPPIFRLTGAPNSLIDNPYVKGITGRVGGSYVVDRDTQLTAGLGGFAGRNPSGYTIKPESADLGIVRKIGPGYLAAQYQRNLMGNRAGDRIMANYAIPFAEGGTPRFLSGGGDGMSDSIPATIGGTQEARLADGEFVIPADVVSHLGNGSSKAGAKQLYSMMDRVRKARTGNEKQGRQIKPTKLMPA